jgi:signal transduction histidine kinase
LAVAAEVLNEQLRVHLDDFGRRVAPQADFLERRFLSYLSRLRYDVRQRKALAAITSGAAARLLAEGRPTADFIEQVEYNGRRLAKLDIAPSEISQALGEYDRIMAPIFRGLGEREVADLRWAREQLSFCAFLTLNNAFYQVREAETQAFFELFRAEIDSTGLDEVLRRFLEILTSYSRAEVGVLFLLDEKGANWVPKASSICGEGSAVNPDTVVQTSSRRTRLSKARYMERGDGTEGCWLADGWSKQYTSCWSIPLSAGGRTSGVMQFAFSKPYQWLPRERELLEGAAERCLRAAERVRLVEDLAAREEQVRRLGEHLLQVEEMERRRISHELHDETGQSLLYIRLRLEMLEKSVPAEHADWVAALAETRNLLEQNIVDIRRLIGALSPAVLAQLGLAPALRQLVSQLRRMSPARVRLQISRLGALPKPTEVMVYRLVQECCNNIIKHSSAERVNISLSSTDRLLRLHVEDDGVGFQVEDALNKRDSFGLAGIRERVALLGGKFDIKSRPQWGTKIRIELPVSKEGKR